MMESKDPGPSRGTDMIRASSQHLGHGMALAASVALFGWIGSKVGEWVGAERIFTLMGILLGGAAGFYNLYVQLVVRPREELKKNSDPTERN
ncbi:MAG: AtpZ/AtpI family protein [Gemmatimonadetes bacterium]|nr:AtpZ/AtpI family protein [Gemmatimonadota bacterium]